MSVRGYLPRFLVLVTVSVFALVALRGSLDDGVSRGNSPPSCPPGGSACGPYVYAPGRNPGDELARKYAPVLFLPEQDQDCDGSGASFEPVPVDAVLGNGEVALRKQSDPGFVKYGPSMADLYEAGRVYFDAYLDFPGNPSRPGCRYERDGRRYAAGQANVAYARIAREGGSGGLVLQYWLFYYFNQASNKHEGDWEMIQLHFDALTVQEALKKDPLRISISQHSSGETASWSDSRVRKEGSRPMIFAAAGSHANFFTPHVYIGRGDDGGGLGCDDASSPGRRLPLDVSVLPPVVKDATSPFAWVAYRGFWGELQGPGFDGSTGPSTKQNWLYPVTWEKGLRSSSVSIPVRNSAGPDAVGAFCDAVAFGSDFVLPVYMELPTASIVAVGLVSLGIVGSLARTCYLPVSTSPLRCRRRIGQIMTSALGIYRRRSLVFLTVGLISMPLIPLLAMLHSAFASVSPLRLELSAADGSVGQKLASAFALSELNFGLAYALVIAATTAVVAGMENNSSAETGPALLQVLRRLPHLVLPRLLAILAIAMLSMTVFLIPLALSLAVRWTFLEQAVLLDGRSGRKAFATSAAAVSANWWWGTGAVLSLSILALAGPAALGIVLILALNSTPLAYVNLIASAVYAVLVPYIGIALCLVYYDLQARREQLTGEVSPGHGRHLPAENGT